MTESQAVPTGDVRWVQETGTWEERYVGGPNLEEWRGPITDERWAEINKPARP